ncbi:MAG: YybH family protein [Micropepsaceae bacterium]
MKSNSIAAVLIFASAAAALSACAPSTEADEAAIRAANKAWLAAIVAKDGKAIVALHAEDAQVLPPNAPKAVGREAIGKAWDGIFALPGLALTFDTEKFVFAKSGEFAVEVGTYSMTVNGQTDTGKSVVTWTKRAGKWVVLTDMFSSDLPVVAAAAPVETPAVPPTP